MPIVCLTEAPLLGGRYTGSYIYCPLRGGIIDTYDRARTCCLVYTITGGKTLTCPIQFSILCLAIAEIRPGLYRHNELRAIAPETA